MMALMTLPVMADKHKTADKPDLAFLEFLAEMEEVEGELVAPVDLLELQQLSSERADLNPGQESLTLQQLLQQIAVSEAALPFVDKGAAIGQLTSPVQHTEKPKDKEEQQP